MLAIVSGKRFFVLEQKVPQELDRVDDDASAIHFIALRDSEPTGTARIVLKDEGKTAKIGRVAILKSARGFGDWENSYGSRAKIAGTAWRDMLGFGFPNVRNAFL
jgi:predicted GNAT family N-acyltransferase